MNGYTIKALLIISLAMLATGCRVAIIVPTGGNVVSSSGAYNCPEASVCEFEVTEAPFSETFTAQASPGYEFERWSNGIDFLCGKSINPACVVSLPDVPVVATIIAFFDSSYVMPIFKDIGIDTDLDGIRNELDEDDDNDGIFDIDDTCPLDPSPSCSEGIPLTDTVTINGTEWAQVDLFTNLSWNDMNAICSGGPCSGVLNGYNMAGWTWASSADVFALFDFYICGLEATGCYSGGSYIEYDSPWAPMIFTDGMRSTEVGGDYRALNGHVSDVRADPNFRDFLFILDKFPLGYPDDVGVLSLSVDQRYGYLGVWFYRTP